MYSQHEDSNLALDGINNTGRRMHASKGIDYVESVSVYNDRTANHYQQTVDLITLPYNEVIYTEQPYATRVERVQPVMLKQWLGRLELNPSSDVWFEQKWPLLL